MKENKNDLNPNELNDSNANDSEKEALKKTTPKKKLEEIDAILKDDSINKIADSAKLNIGLLPYLDPDKILKNLELYKSFQSTSILGNFKNNLLPDSTWANQLNLSDEINDLKRKLKKAVVDLEDTEIDRDNLVNKIDEIEKINTELIAKQQTNHILTRISEEGRKKLLESEPFHKLFKNSSKYDTVVVSIDIRRSTELMLKARTPELFSQFITELSFKLSQIIIANYGIFDKFTGDGIMAFFPKFYSGNEAIIRALKASRECHSIFKDHYNKSRECFNVFIKDVGLGIGIDYGNVTLVNTQSELTVVGIPVVYACRFSGANAGETILNQPAKEEIMRLCPTTTTFNEAEINIKNEGVALGYHVSLNDAAFDVPIPDWDALIVEYGIEEQ